MEQYAVIWVKENTRKELKKVAAQDEMSMRELATIIIDTWIEEHQQRSRNETIKPLAVAPPKKKLDATAKDAAD